MRKMRKPLAFLLALCMTLNMSVLTASATEPTPQAEEQTAELTNLALGKTVTASGADANHPASKAVDGIVNTEKDDRWAIEGVRTGSLVVDLEQESEIKEFRVVAENEKNKLTKITIEGSNDNAAYTQICEETADNAVGIELDKIITLDSAVNYRYVKITVEKNFNGSWGSISLREFEVRGTAAGSGEEPGGEDPIVQPNVNLALSKTVEASAEYATLPKSNLTDADEDSRWSTEANATQWAYVDLGAEYSMNYFRMVWESADNHAADYNIYVSNDTENWGTAVVAQTGNAAAISENELTEAVSGRYVKLEVTKQAGYPSVSCRDFKVMLKDDSVQVQDPTENVALNKTAVAAPNLEDPSLTADKVVDGDKTSKPSRWAANAKPTWVYVDFGKEQDVRTVKLFWERRNATNYEIQTASAAPDQEASWTTVKSFNAAPTAAEQTIVLDAAVKAQYVRVKVNDYITNADGIDWNSVALYEVEVYGGAPAEPEVSIDTVLAAIEVTQPTAETTTLEVTLPEEEGYTVKYNGTDYEQVIGADRTIYKPVVETTVKASFKVTEDATGEYKFREIDVTVPGQYTQAQGDNAAPAVLPELREWKGQTGTFAPTASSRIVYTDDSLKAMAEAFAADYEDITDKKITAAKAEAANAGDFFFTLTSDTSKGLQDEGYLMTIAADGVTVEAETATGAYWATRTILQSLKQTDNIPCGITRDYPQYKVRGFILDVGRKTFTMDYLEQFVKEMSWYKMNDFQIHLNDNLIPLEDYTRVGKDPMQAYSAFRLESDVKEGGNGGLNKADLTSKDVFYTKEQFRNFIKESRVLGVNIVPEIDTPAHSLALTKVRPDLRQGLSGRQNDHLNLKDRYDDCLNFVQGIFGEYMTETNPVFDENTIVHVGADEYGGANENYRRFCNDMTQYVKDSGRQARIWGSLTWLPGETDVIGEDVQMNLWNFGWANMDEMYEEGFDLINCNDGNYYIVPAAGYYYDYLNAGVMYDLPINSIGGITIPAGDEQMIGGAFAVWNDMTDYLENGMSEYDIFDRSNQHLALFASKLWGKSGNLSLADAKARSAQLGVAPNTNFGYEVEDTDGVILHEDLNIVENPVNAAAAQADGKNALELKGGASYVETGIETVGLGNDLRVKVKRTSDSTEEQILFESSYGSIKAVQKGTGKVGFSRENHDYSFDYTLPVDEWVELEFKNVKDTAQLYVNGVLVDTLGDNDKTSNEMADLTGNYKPLHATTMFPIEKIGSETNAFIGYVDDVRVGVSADYNSTMELDYAVITANALLAETENEELAALVEQADAIFEKFAPTAEEIKALADAINEAIAAAEFEEADYSRVNAYKELVADLDLSVFTEQSVARLNSVLASIREGLPASMQSTVDGYEALLADALNGLEQKTEANINYVAKEDITPTASSNQDNGSAPGKANDDEAGTMWHSQWNKGGDGYNAAEPHYFDMQLDKTIGVNGLTYIPRSGGGNGTIKQYEIVAYDDDLNTATVIASGTWAANDEPKVVAFESAVHAKHIRVKVVTSVHNDASAVEFKLHKADVAPDLDGLNAIIAKAEAVENTDNKYTEATWNALQDKLAEATELANAQNPDANDVEIMKRELSDAITSLVLNAKPDEPEKKTATLSGTTSENGKPLFGVDIYVKQGEDIVTKVTTGLDGKYCVYDLPYGEYDLTFVKKGYDPRTLTITVDRETMTLEDIALKKTEGGGEHTHEFGTEWKSDVNSHWHECTCGEKSEMAKHTFGEWKVTKPATEAAAGTKERVCSACGRKETVQIPKLEPEVPGDSSDNNNGNDSNSGSSNSGSSSNTSGVAGAKTGDASNPGLYLAVLALAAAGLTVLYRRRRQF